MVISVYNGAGEKVSTVLTEHLFEPLLNFNFGGNTVITTMSGAGSAVTLYAGGDPVGSWNGTTQDGSPATNGTYYIKVDNIDNMGEDRSTTQTVQVSRAFYQTTVDIYNEAGEVVRRLYLFADNPGAPGSTGIQFSTKTIAPGANLGAGVPSQLTVTLSNGTTLVWDGTGDNGSYVTGGQYLVELHTVDGSGGETVFSQQVSVIDGHRSNGVGTITAWPNVLGAAGPPLTTFHSDSSLPETLEVSVYDSAGELVRPAQKGPAGQGWVSFDGSGLASGIYLAVVRIDNPAGGLQGRHNLKLAITH
jgi:flagellar hook assembly protein FlgD